jgi:hypothetical protein
MRRRVSRRPGCPSSRFSRQDSDQKRAAGRTLGSEAGIAPARLAIKLEGKTIFDVNLKFNMRSGQ